MTMAAVEIESRNVLALLSAACVSLFACMAHMSFGPAAAVTVVVGTNSGASGRSRRRKSRLERSPRADVFGAWVLVGAASPNRMHA